MAPFALLQPAGAIALAERHLIIVAVILMLIVAIPMYIILFTFARKYRADNPNAATKYSPNLNNNAWVTFGLWAVPITLIGILSVINWQSTHALDPSVPINSNVPPLTIQVIALPWKFLFIYPTQNIATVNYIEFPEGTPLHFELTADAPMSSFWIPQLGSQIYAMPAMTTQLNLIANTTGDFRGLDTEINGVGFSGMKFVARSATQSDYAAWLTSVQQSGDTLTLDDYNVLAQPSENNPTASYASVDPNLYNEVVMKYMEPTSTMQGMSPGQTMPGMQM